MTKRERAVLKAAMRCVNPKGYSFYTSSTGLKGQDINVRAFLSLEAAVVAYRTAQSKGRKK